MVPKPTEVENTIQLNLGVVFNFPLGMFDDDCSSQFINA